MKSSILLLALFILPAIIWAQYSKDQFVINGSISGVEGGVLYLSYSNSNNKRVMDSARIKNGKFSFNGSINGPTIAYLTLKGAKRNENNSVSFFIDPAVMSVILPFNRFNAATFNGAKTQNEYAKLKKQKQKIQERWKVVMDTLSEVNKRSNVEFQKLKDWVLQPYNEEIKELDFNFFRAHPQSPVTAYTLRFYVSGLPLDSLQMYYDKLGEKLQQTNDGKDLANEILKLRGGSPGSIAKDFTAVDINGNQLSLSDFKGRYVLLDFWASWCVPCRAGNPHLKELYSKYKDKGIEFIGVSDDDRNHAAWRKAVEMDGLPWRQVLRGFDMKKLMNNEPNPKDIAEKYGISTLPTKILIDPNGKIIGRYGEEEKALDAKLKDIFGF